MSHLSKKKKLSQHFIYIKTLENLIILSIKNKLEKPFPSTWKKERNYHYTVYENKTN